MKKILLVLFITTHFVYGQHIQLFPDFSPEKNKPAARMPNVVLKGLDSVEIKSAYIGLMIQKQIFRYDGYGNTIEEISYTYTNGSIDDGTRKTIVYDALQRPTEAIDYTYNNGAWEENTKTLNTYAGNSFDLDYQIIQTYSGGTWQNQYRITYAYNSGLLVEQIRMIWDGASWVNDAKTVYTYTSSQLTVKTTYTWTGANWANNSKVEYTYDANGNMTERIFFMWDTSSNQWQYTDKDTYTYNAQNLIEEEINYIYDGTQWVYNDKADYYFNASYDMNREEHFDYDTSSSSWTNRMKFEFNHNNSVDRSGLLLPYDDGSYTLNGLFNHQPVSGRVYQGNSSGWSYVADIDFYYTDYDVTVSIDEEHAATIKIYPNPVAGNFINITAKANHIESVKIYSLTGNLVKSFSSDVPVMNYSIPVNDLPAGIYLMKISGNNTTTTVKFQKL
jgi:hypothetical protein